MEAFLQSAILLLYLMMAARLDSLSQSAQLMQRHYYFLCNIPHCGPVHYCSPYGLYVRACAPAAHSHMLNPSARLLSYALHKPCG